MDWISFSIGIICGFAIGSIIMFFAADFWMRAYSETVQAVCKDNIKLINDFSKIRSDYVNEIAELNSIITGTNSTN